MRKLQYFFSGLLGLLLATGIPSCQTAAKNASDDKLLQFTFEKGKEYGYELVSETEVEIPGQGFMTTSFVNSYTMKMTRLENTIHHIDVTYKRMANTTNIAGQESGFDNEKPGTGNGTENPWAMYVNMIGKKFSITVDAEGKVLSVSGFEKLLKDMIDSPAMDEEQKGKANSMREKMSDVAMAGLFGPIFGLYPNKEVRQGDSWEKNFVTTSFFGPSNCNSKYRVKMIVGDFFTLG